MNPQSDRCKGTGHYWWILKIIINIKPYLVPSNGERLIEVGVSKSESTQVRVTRVFFSIIIISCNFDYQLSQNFHRFVIVGLCIMWTTPCENTILKGGSAWGGGTQPCPCSPLLPHEWTAIHPFKHVIWFPVWNCTGSRVTVFPRKSYMQHFLSLPSCRLIVSCQEHYIPATVDVSLTNT